MLRKPWNGSGGHPDLLDSPIGLMGFSEGGWVAPITAAARPDIVDFLVLESGAIVTPGAQIRYHRAAETGSLPLYRRFLARLYTEFAVLKCDYSRFNLLPHLAPISQPIYAVWGANDHTIPIEQTRSLLVENTSIHPQVEVIEQQPHYLNPEGEWLIKVADWILALPRDQHQE